MRRLIKPNMKSMQTKKGLKGLIKTLGSGNEKTGKAAAQALLCLKENETVPALLNALNASPNTQVRFHAARLLGEINLPQKETHIKHEMIEALLEALQDKEDTVRINAVMALGKKGDIRVSQEILSLLVAETNPLLRFAEVQALGDIGAIYPDHLALLVLTMLVIINDESHWPATRECAEKTLILFGTKCLPYLVELMQHEDPLISLRAIIMFENISTNKKGGYDEYRKK